MKARPKSEAKCVKQSTIPLQCLFGVGDKFWILNPEHSKLKPENVGRAVVAVVHPNNIYTVKGLKKKHFNKTNDLHHD